MTSGFLGQKEITEKTFSNHMLQVSDYEEEAEAQSNINKL